MEATQYNAQLTSGGPVQFSLPTDKEKEQERDTWNKSLFRSIFTSAENGVKYNFLLNGIDGGYGEASNMINRGLRKNMQKFRPFRRLVLGTLTKILDKSAAKLNQPYMDYLSATENMKVWNNFQYMHSKMGLFDRIVSLVGSYNLEEWSSDKSHESAVICMDEGLSEQMDISFLRDYVNSTPILKE